MSSLPQPARALPAILCAVVVLATSACVAPPYIVLRPLAAAPPPAATRPKVVARDRRCEQPARPVLTEAEKTRLFDEFDGWQDERRPSGPTADAPAPPAAPAGNRPTPPGCRVSRN